jgi:hypothetical protein
MYTSKGNGGEEGGCWAEVLIADEELPELPELQRDVAWLPFGQMTERVLKIGDLTQGEA